MQNKGLKLLFMGRKASAARALRWAYENGFEVVGVITDTHLSGSATEEVAQELKLPLYTQDVMYTLIQDGRIQFDLAVSFVYWRRIREPLLSFPALGIINFHPAPLPAYKGVAGYNVAILEGRNTWSISAHYMNADFDAGPIIRTKTFAINPELETAQTLEAQSQDHMLEMYKEVLKDVLAYGRLPVMENAGGKYISRKEMEAMKEVQAGDDIERKIRAFWFPPYTGAYIIINEKKYTLVNDYLLQSMLKPGQTFKFKDE